MFLRLDIRLSQARKILQSQVDGHPWLLLVAIGVGAFIVFTVFSIERYLALQSNFFDLGLDSNSLWRTINGYDSWTSLIFPSTPGHINHISPILGLVALVYAIVPDPRTLLVIQAGAVTLAIVPLYLLAMRETHSQLVSLAVAGLYLVNPGLHGIVRYDFHPEAFIPLFVFLVYYFYSGSRPGLFYLSVGLMLATIEYSAVLGLGISLSLWLTKKHLDKRILATLLSSLLLIGIILISTIGRAFEAFNWPSNWLAVQFFGVASSQNTLSLQPVEAFLNNPGVMITFIQYNLVAKATYLLIVLAPAWLAALKYSTRMLPAIPWVAVVLTSSRYSYSNIDFQYSVFLIPFLYIAAIPFFYQIKKRRKLVLSLAALALSIMLLYSAISPVGPSQQWPQPNPLFSAVASVGDSIPQNATILTQSDLYPQLSNKAHVTLNYSYVEPPQYILVNTQTSWYDWTNPSLGYPLSTHQQLDRFTSHYSYRLTFVDMGLHLYKLDTASVTSS